MEIRPDDLKGSRVARLLAAHLSEIEPHSPPESRHAFDLAALRAPDVSFWAVWEGGGLLGFGALKEIGARHGEVKSMHVAREHRGRGVAAAILTHIIAVARARGFDRLVLETGSMAAFAPARALYGRFGFAPCPPFGSYRPDRNNVFLALDLREV